MLMEGGVIRQGKGVGIGIVSPLYMGPYGAHHCKRREKRWLSERVFKFGV